MNSPRNALIMIILSIILLPSPPLTTAGPYTEAGIAADDPSIVEWASGWLNEVRGPMDIAHPEAGNASFGSADNALGPAACNVYEVVSLGDGGELTLTFDLPIRDGPGDDLVVFENGFAAGGLVYAELAFVEVSSDGVTFARFPAVSLTATPVPPYGLLDPTDTFHLAGKHPGGNQSPCYGTGFDLASLRGDPAVLRGEVNLDEIRFVKVVDAVGDGSRLDSQGNPIYDPYPTAFSSGGFDLQAVGVRNRLLCTDLDGDGFSIEGGSCGPVDCDDADPAVNPAVSEGPPGDPTCHDGVDNNCDGSIDGEDQGCAGAPPWSGVPLAHADPLLSAPCAESGRVNAVAAFLFPACLVSASGAWRRWTAHRRRIAHFRGGAGG